MKRISAFILVTASCLFSIAVPAQDKEKQNEPKYKKTKAYSKSYSLSGSDKISLNNQFGEMKLVTWEKSEIKVDVSITGKSDNEKRAQEIVDRISISDGKNGNTVFYKTKFANENGRDDNKGEHNNEGMEINYVVYLPSGNALTAEHQFGNMIVPDYKGESRIECKFGKLTAGKLSNSKVLTIEFGDANVQQVNGGDLNIKFSSGTVNKLSGDIRSDLQFSEVKLNFDNDLKNLNIDNSYSAVYLDVDKNFSANWDIHTSHGEFDNKTAFAIKEDGQDDNRYGPRFNSNYKGVSGSGTGKVKINSSFGSITVGHNLQIDVTEKKKAKNANKNKNKVI